MRIIQCVGYNRGTQMEQSLLNSDKSRRSFIRSLTAMLVYCEDRLVHSLFKYDRKGEIGPQPHFVTAWVCTGWKANRVSPNIPISNFHPLKMDNNEAKCTRYPVSDDKRTIDLAFVERKMRRDSGLK